MSWLRLRWDCAFLLGIVFQIGNYFTMSMKMILLYPIVALIQVTHSRFKEGSLHSIIEDVGGVEEEVIVFIVDSATWLFNVYILIAVAVSSEIQGIGNARLLIDYFHLTRHPVQKEWNSQH